MAFVTYYPFPVFTKSWQWYVNQLIDSDTTASLESAGAALAIKNGLCWSGFTAPWTLKGCSNSVSSNMSGIDLLLTKSNFVGGAAGAAHSWMVLRSPAGQELCMDFSSASGIYLAALYVSHAAGFTGGSTTNRPTATDEMSVRATTASPAAWIAGTGTVNARLRFHIIHSSDGFSTTVLVTYQQVTVMMWMLGKLNEAVGGLDNGLYAVCSATSSSSNSLTNTFAQVWTNHVNFGITVGRGASSALDLRPSPRVTASSAGQVLSATKDALPNRLANAESRLSNLFALHEFGYVSLTSGKAGRMGKAVDKWITTAGYGAGDILTAPDGSRSAAVFGNFAHPWPLKTNSFVY